MTVYFSYIKANTYTYVSECWLSIQAYRDAYAALASDVQNLSDNQMSSITSLMVSPLLFLLCWINVWQNAWNDVPCKINAVKHVALNIACVHSQRYTKYSNVWPKSDEFPCTPLFASLVPYHLNHNWPKIFTHYLTITLVEKKGKFNVYCKNLVYFL